MPDRVLVEIVTAANMTGIKQAQAGFLSMSSALSVAVAGLGLLAVAGKSAMDIAEKHQKAESDLAQAVQAVNAEYGTTTPRTVDLSKQTDTLTAARRHLAEVEAGLPTKHKATRLQLMHLQDAQKQVKDAQRALTAAQAASLPIQHTQMIYLESYRAEINKFIDDNRAYISDQSEVIDGYATLTRSGLNVNEVQKDMNRALDLAAIKDISVADAVALINNAEHGRLRGLVDLGITSKAYVDSSGNVIDANKNMAKVMAELDAKTAHGRDTTTEMVQSTNRLGNDWQDIANNVGPPLLGLFDGILRGADFVIQKLNELGRNKDWNAAISAGLGFIQDQITMLIRGAQQLIDAFKWLAGNVPQANAIAAGTPGRYGRQGGGYVWPGNTYTVGESRPEGLTMFPGGGGYVSSSAPSSSGGGGRGSMTVNVYGYVGDNRQLALTIRESLRRLDREQR